MDMTNSPPPSPPGTTAASSRVPCPPPESVTVPMFLGVPVAESAPGRPLVSLMGAGFEGGAKPTDMAGGLQQASQNVSRWVTRTFRSEDGASASASTNTVLRKRSRYEGQDVPARSDDQPACYRITAQGLREVTSKRTRHQAEPDMSRPENKAPDNSQVMHAFLSRGELPDPVPESVVHYLTTTRNNLGIVIGSAPGISQDLYLRMFPFCALCIMGQAYLLRAGTPEEYDQLVQHQKNLVTAIVENNRLPALTIQAQLAARMAGDHPIPLRDYYQMQAVAMNDYVNPRILDALVGGNVSVFSGIGRPDQQRDRDTLTLLEWQLSAALDDLAISGAVAGDALIKQSESLRHVTLRAGSRKLFISCDHHPHYVFTVLALLKSICIALKGQSFAVAETTMAELSKYNDFLSFSDALSDAETMEALSPVEPMDC